MVTSSGYTYERSALLQFAEQCLLKNQEPHDPITRELFDPNTQMVCNRAQKDAIDEWRTRAGASRTNSPLSAHPFNEEEEKEKKEKKEKKETKLY